jgi:hypothetical protein
MVLRSRRLGVTLHFPCSGDEVLAFFFWLVLLLTSLSCLSLVLKRGVGTVHFRFIFAAIVLVYGVTKTDYCSV